MAYYILMISTKQENKFQEVPTEHRLILRSPQDNNIVYSSGEVKGGGAIYTLRKGGMEWKEGY